MVVIHQTAEVQHIGVVPLAVQAVQHGDKAASQARKNNVADMDKTTKIWNGVADNTLLNRRKVSSLRRDCLTLTCVLTNAPKYDNLTQVSKTPKEGPV